MSTSDRDPVHELALEIQRAYEGDLPTGSFALTDLTEWTEDRIRDLMRRHQTEAA
jgi:hypothetical protein